MTCENTLPNGSPCPREAVVAVGEQHTPLCLPCAQSEPYKAETTRFTIPLRKGKR